MKKLGSAIALVGIGILIGYCFHRFVVYGPTTTKEDRAERQIDADDLSRESRARLEKILSKSIAQATTEFITQLQLHDPIERKLFEQLLDFTGEESQSRSVWAIVLVQAGQERLQPYHVLLQDRGKVRLIYTRLTSAIAIPSAFLSELADENGAIVLKKQQELVYRNDRWVAKE